MSGIAEENPGRSRFDDAARVHDQHAVGQRCHDREIVAHVQRGHAIVAAQSADGLQHVGLGGDVKTGGRLVEHDHRRPAGERHGERHPLLLAAGELMRVALQERRLCRQLDFLEHLEHALAALSVVQARLVDGEHLLELQADAKGRIERGGWILRDVRHGVTSRRVQRDRIQLRACRGRRSVTRPAVDLAAAPAMTQQGKTDRGLAGAGFAHQPHDLGRLDLEVDLVDDVEGRAGEADAQPGHLDDGRDHVALLRPMPMAERAIPSVIRLVPTVRSPTAMTGSTTGQGWMSVRPGSH